MEEVNDIPKGKYCKGCKYNTTITRKTINMFGDDSGYLETYYCSFYNCELNNNYYYFDFMEQIIEPNTKCFQCLLNTELFNNEQK